MSRYKLELLLHPGDEFLGSLEPDSLQVLTYVKQRSVTKVDELTINTSCVPIHFPRDHPPLLRLGSTILASGAEAIITYLQEQEFDTVNQLTDQQQSEVLAFCSLVNDKLLPAIIYSRWLNSQNYVEVTRSSYGKLLYFPFSLVYLSWQHRYAQHFIMKRVPPELTQEQKGLELFNKAEECIHLMSVRLGEQNYFYGDRPSSLDAYMFGYLEGILQTPLPSDNFLLNKTTACTNLVKFCQRMRREFFPKKKIRSSSSGSISASSTPPTLWRDSTLWFSVGMATFVLCLQGVRVGLFHQVNHWVSRNIQRLV